MQFEERSVEASFGWSLAHSVACGSRRLAKGTILSEEIIDDLLQSGVTSVQVFRLDEHDYDEDTAAKVAAKLICGDNLAVTLEGRGRANLISNVDGIFIPHQAIDDLNTLDDAFSAASLRPFSVVHTGQLVATIKLVPYGVAKSVLQDTDSLEKCRVAEFMPFEAALISSGNDMTEKTRTVLEKRINSVKGNIVSSYQVLHTVTDVTNMLHSSAKTNADLILMLGASAISDIRDTLPAALLSAGGSIEKLGMPADPGNLLMLGALGTKMVIGLPGCARSPSLNGFDWVLQRYAAKLKLDKDIIASMGTGGLLKEPVGRRVPRTDNAFSKGSDSPGFAAIVLAAGRSTRAESAHKLLSLIGDTPVISATLSAIESAGAMNTVVVTGDAREKIEACTKGLAVDVVHNKDFKSGMGSSIAEGISAIRPESDYVFICLADMPFVQPATLKALMATAKTQNSSAIIVPTFNGKRGHPVLWDSKFIPELSRLSGDVGGRNVMYHHREKIIEVPVQDPGILIDLDTPEMLAQFGVKPTAR